MGIYQFVPEPDPHFRFLCEHGARCMVIFRRPSVEVPSAINPIQYCMYGYFQAAFCGSPKRNQPDTVLYVLLFSGGLLWKSQTQSTRYSTVCMVIFRHSSVEVPSAINPIQFCMYGYFQAAFCGGPKRNQPDKVLYVWLFSGGLLWKSQTQSTRYSTVCMVIFRRPSVEIQNAINPIKHVHLLMASPKSKVNSFVFRLQGSNGLRQNP